MSDIDKWSVQLVQGSMSALQCDVALKNMLSSSPVLFHCEHPTDFHGQGDAHYDKIEHNCISCDNEYRVLHGERSKLLVKDFSSI